MAEQGVVLDIDTQFLRRLEKADAALGNLITSADKVSRQFDNMASGSLRNFASAIDAIVSSVNKIANVDVGDMGLNKVSSIAAETVDSVNNVANAVDKILFNDKAYSNSALIKVNSEIDDTEAKLKRVQELLNFYAKGEGKAAIGFVDTSGLQAEGRTLMNQLDLLERQRASIIANSRLRLTLDAQQSARMRDWNDMEAERNERIQRRAAIENRLAKESSDRYVREQSESERMYKGLFDKTISEKNNQLAQEYELEENYRKRNLSAQEAYYEEMRKWRERSLPKEQSRESLYSEELRQYEEMHKKRIANDEQFARNMNAKRQEQERVAIEAERAISDYETKSEKERYEAWLMQKHAEEKEHKRIEEAKFQATLDVINKQNKAYEKQEAQKQKELTTFSGAMGYSQSTGSINQQIQAIKYLKEARDKLDKTTLGQKEYKRQVSEINKEIRRQQSEVDTLRDKHTQLGQVTNKLKSLMTAAFSIQAIRGYVNQIISVRGEFELQNRALQAILGNKAEANKLWNQTVQLAVKSPFQVKELVTYTKQLAAYRVETDKLHDTTKMLADISAGLGVDMGRLILAFGQVKAANYLRGTELRQFSEAGINILDELARYYTAVEGKAVTVGEVFERVSKRMVTFTDVETVLKNVTSAGGMFYQMQEIQAETLKGSISNLKDQLDLMLNDIGEKNDGILKGGVQTISFLIKNYESLIPVLSAVALGFMGMYVSTQRVKIGLNAVGKGAVSLAKGLVNPWMLGLAAISEVISMIIRYKSEVKQIEKEHKRLRNSLDEISLSLNDAMDSKKIDDARVSLSQLLEVAKNDFQIDFGLSTEAIQAMDLSALKTKFEELRGVLFDANAIAESVKRGLASDEIWDTTIIRFLKTALTPAGLFGARGGESMAKDIEQFESTASTTMSEIQSESVRIAKELNLDKYHMLRLPQTDIETDLQYLERLRRAYESLKEDMEMKDIETDEIDKLISKLDRQMGEAATELGIFLAQYKDKTASLTEEGLKAFINDIATYKGWTEYTRELVYRYYNLDLERNLPSPATQIPGEDSLENQPDGSSTSRDTRWQDLLGTIKEVNKAYKDLVKTFDEATAREGMMAKYAESLDDVLSKVRINGQQMTSSSFMEMFDLTTEEGMLKALDMIAKEAPDAADKLKAKLEKGEIVWEAKIKTKEENDADLQRQMEELFSGYELSLELDKLNIPKSFAQDFFNIEAMSLPDLRSKVESMRPQFVGTEQEKEYQKYLDKISEMETKAQQERLKTYLQYARDAISERAKIKLDEVHKLQEIEMTFAKDAPERESAIKKVKEDSIQAQNKQDWEDFQKSSTFVSLFEDLDSASDALLHHAIERLQDFQDQWQDMPYEEMKDIVDKISKLREHIAESDPFGAQFKETRKRVREDGRSTSEIEEENIGIESEIESSQAYIAELETILRLREEKKWQEKYLASLGLENVNIIGMETDEIRKVLAAEKNRVKQAKENLANNNASLEDQKLLKAYYLSQADAIQDAQKMANDLYDAFTELVDVLGGSDSPEAVFAEMGMSMMNSVMNCFALQLQLKAATVEAHTFGAAMNAAMGIIGWIVMAIQLISAVLKAIFAAKDNKLEKQIERIQERVDRLAKTLEDLEENFDKAFSVQGLQSYSNAITKNIEEQIRAYEQMIALEEDKKKTDHDKIDEWREAQEDLRETLKEIYEEGFSTASAGILDDILDAADAFVDAWYEAFQETGDGLSGLEQEFNDMLTDIIKRQAALQIVGEYTKMYSDWLKEYLNVEAGDATLTTAEATEWAKRVRDTLPELSSLLENFFNGTQDLLQEQGELSDLSKGIQGVTESTAQALEALLNSMRFYVADSNLRLRNIESAFANDDIANNPLLNELRQQTILIRSIEDMFSSVIGRGDSSHSGAYLKVLM